MIRLNGKEKHMTRTLFLLLSLTVSSVIGAQTLPDIEKVPIKGNCDTFNLHRERLGISDDKGVPHPGFAGWTSVTITYAYNTRYTYTRSRGKIRLKATVNVTFSGKAVPTRLDWIPPAPLPAACYREKQRWERQVEEHEYQHVRDFHMVMKSAGAKWRGGWNLEVEGATLAQASAELDRRVKSALSAEAQRVLDQYNRITEAFHRSPQGRPIGDINCRACSTRS